MFPLRDDNPAEIFPLFTLGIITACVAVWVMVQGAGMNEEVLWSSVCTYGAIPGELSGRVEGEQVCALGGLTWGALFSSMFLHGSWMHLIGNMWFMWIFGNNVEDSMGHLRFGVFYLLCGLVAGGAHVLSSPDSAVPTVGASGAISAIMGAYLVLYPKARVQTLIFLVIFARLLVLPAWFFLVYWFFIQLVSGYGASAEGGGVAFWAHVGGFVAGVLLIFPFRNPRLVEAKRSGVKLSREQIGRAGWV
jgi:membrane associated rhomboid family serine protease